MTRLPYGEEFSRDKIFADLPQTAKILTAKFCDRRALCFVIVKPRNFFREIYASGQFAKILSRENFSPYGIPLFVKGMAARLCTSLLHNVMAYWLKHWTADRKVQGSSPTSSRDLFLFWVHSALPQKLSRRFSFASFGGDVKLSVPGNPLKLAQVLLGISSLTGSSQVNHNK